MSWCEHIPLLKAQTRGTRRDALESPRGRLRRAPRYETESETQGPRAQPLI